MDITPAFAAALRKRRDSQATALIERFRPSLSSGPVLDYGCGQGAFVGQLLAAGLDGWGCDLSLPSAMGERVEVLPSPWALPKRTPPGGWGTIALLDVLEHHPYPGEFLATLPHSRFLLVKVPLCTGPIGTGATTLARLGWAGILESLFLLDAAPHQVFFTRQGLEATALPAHWKLNEFFPLADVGSELPERIRGSLAGIASNRLVKPALRGVGAAVAASARYWADTAAFLFERTRSS